MFVLHPSLRSRDMGRAAASKRVSRDVIVAATIKLFGQQGYPGTSVRDIANAVGLLPGSLYVHIESKEELLAQIVESGIDRFLDACQPALDLTAPADVRMRAAIVAHMEAVGEAAEHMLVALRQWRYLSGDLRASVMAKRRRYEAIFSTIIDDGVAAGDFSEDLNRRIAVLTVIGTLNWAAEWFSPDGRETAQEVGDDIADVLLSGLSGS